MAPAPAGIGDFADAGDEDRRGETRRSFGHRRAHRSRQARLIQAALENVDGFLSAQDLYAQFRRAGQPVGLSTVYRCLHDLLDTGAVDLVVSETGETLYRHREARQRELSEHHHYLVCRSCGAAVEIDSPTIEKWLASIGHDSGFDRLEHRVEVFGRCPPCRANTEGTNTVTRTGPHERAARPTVRESP